MRIVTAAILCLLTMLAATALVADSTQPSGPMMVEIVYVGDQDRPAFFGVRQGLAESNLQGRFSGQRYELRTAGAAEQVPAGVAIVAAMSDADLLSLAQRLPRVPVLNLVSETDALRALCLPNLLHIVPTRGMKDAAIAQWRTLHPGAEVAARAWEPSFTKYSAEQLSKRYFKASGRAMDDQAWAGWAAVRLVSDTVARVGNAAPEAILAYLKTKTAFDGQKGIDLSFRSDGQLRQPLWVVAGGRVVGEAPVRGVAEPEDLDSLGRAACPRANN